MVIIVDYHALMELTIMDMVAILAIKVVLLVLDIGILNVIVALLDIIFSQVQPIATIHAQVQQHIGTK